MWNFKNIPGQISGGDLHEYLCFEILRIFQGRFLETISANNFVVEYKDVLGEISENGFSEYLSREYLKNFLGEISRNSFSKYLCRGILRIFWGRFLGTFCHRIFAVEHLNNYGVPLAIISALNVSVCRAAARTLFGVSK